MEVLKAVNLTKIYGKGENQVRALDGVSLSVEQGQFAAVVGTSGSGKSTLLHMLGGLDRPDEGKVYVDGKDIFSEGGGPDHFPAQEDRLCVPVLQSGAGAERL